MTVLSWQTVEEIQFLRRGGKHFGTGVQRRFVGPGGGQARDFVADVGLGDSSGGRQSGQADDGGTRCGKLPCQRASFEVAKAR